ncbi:MAG TPA: surface-adhesin E family protein [Gemmatimonadaceae bacterium]
MRTLIASLFLPAVALAFHATPASAQGRWKEIGKTAAGNLIYIDPKSVKTANGIITAHLQVKFVTPVQVPNKGEWHLSRHVESFDCAKKTVATKESTYYGDYAGTKVMQHDVVKIPGFATAIGGSLTAIALEYVCRGK